MEADWILLVHRNVDIYFFGLRARMAKTPSVVLSSTLGGVSLVILSCLEQLACHR